MGSNFTMGVEHPESVAMKLLVVLLCLGVATGYYTNDEIRNPGPRVVATQGQPWPKPQVRVDYKGYMIVRPSAFQFKVTGKDCALLRGAIARYTDLISSYVWTKNADTPKAYKPWKKDRNFKGYLDVIQVYLMQPCESWPSAHMDEHYEIKINNPDTPKAGILTSETVWGIMRGLETIVQLMYPASDDVGLKIPSTLVEDFPRFSFRGVMLDTARHFLPTKKILETLDLMAMNKFNVFHWHLVDDQSFPYQSSAFPELSEKGAYNPVTHVYNHENISKVINYARARGIRVIAEFDTPGHTQSWGPGQPGLLTPCYTKKKPDGTYGPIDPTNEDNFNFLKAFFHDARDLFEDKYIHLGGDEVSFSCWESNPQVTNFMEKRNITGDYSLLEQYYVQRLVDIMDEQGSSYIVWQEVVDNNVTVNNKTIVEVWKDGYKEELDKVTGMGYQTILSACWYLSDFSYGADWHAFYQCDPHDFNGTESQNRLVLGGEACMWGEFVDASNLTPRLWPRASSVAERLWSSKDTTDMDDAEKRLEEHRCRMVARGHPVQPPNGPGFCPIEWDHAD